MTQVVLPPPGAALSPAEIAVRSRSNFLVAMRCMAPAARAGMIAIYAFCRVADDAVDDAKDRAVALAHLQFWRDELEAAAGGAPRTQVGQQLQTAMRTFGLPVAALREVLDGMAMDVDGVAFDDLPQLAVYCHRVAGAVGVACLPVMGVHGAAGVRLAEALGLALQLTNILRDLAADAADGRVYVPRDWLRECGVEAAWLAGNGPDAVYAPDGPCARLRQRLAAKAEEQFAVVAHELRQMTARERQALLAPRIMGAVYRSLLRRLRARGGDLRGPRVRVPKLQKLWLAALVAIGGMA